jgi:hypothetical protein
VCANWWQEFRGRKAWIGWSVLAQKWIVVYHDDSGGCEYLTDEELRKVNDQS